MYYKEVLVAMTSSDASLKHARARFRWSQSRVRANSTRRRTPAPAVPPEVPALSRQATAASAALLECCVRPVFDTKNGEYFTILNLEIEKKSLVSSVFRQNKHVQKVEVFCSWMRC